MKPAAHSAPWSVGRYVLYDEIAAGGMATVYFGRLQGAAGFSRSVAIKRLHPQFAKDPDFVAMFVDEARLAARISHPNVVPTLDVVPHANELLLVMEYVHGASLSRLLRTLGHAGERMHPRVAASIVAGTLHGLHAAHEAKGETGQPLGIVHRDVSPQNVLVGADGVARVLDFGVAKAAGRLQSTQRGQLKGKIAYMAPEQITSHEVTRKADIYAAAVVLWEALTGRRMFRADNEARLLALVLQGRVEPPSAVVPGLHPAFDRVIARGLDPDPARRFATAREMAAEVEAAVAVATHSEVGAWVEHVASSELHQRAHRIEEIERSVPAPARPTPKTIPPEPKSQALLMGMARTHSPAERARRRSIVLVAAALLGAALAVAALGIHGPRPAPAASPVTPASAAPREQEPPHPEPAPDPSPSVVPPPIAATPRSASPAASALPASGAPRSSIRSGRSTRPTPSPAPRVDCTPPYTADGNGHIHFKPECVN